MSADAGTKRGRRQQLRRKGPATPDEKRPPSARGKRQSSGSKLSEVGRLRIRKCQCLQLAKHDCLVYASAVDTAC
eukprot:1569367-Rhodomonas_salina.5